jgi:sporulation protein YlmC with PRC-barrel domain
MYETRQTSVTGLGYAVVDHGLWAVASAAEGAGMQVTSGEIEVETMPSVLSASALIGSKVQSPRGDDLGRIDDLILDQDRGCVAYAVMSSGGFLGLGDKRLAIPWHALTFDSQKQLFVLDIDRQMLERAPGFNGESRFDLIDAEGLRGIYIYYGQSPYWEEP